MTTPNILNLSDEDLLKMDPSQLAQASNTEAETTTTSAEEEQVESTEGQQEAGNEETNTESTGAEGEQSGEGTGDEQSTDEQDEGNGSEGERQEPTQNPHAAGQEVPADKTKPETKSNAEPKAGDKPATGEGKDERDYKAELERVLSPIKANGREIQVSSVEDAIQLMQMGANYHKKMAALKPNMAVLKMLENNGLLDQEKLSYLIDLDKKNPEAIKKLLKDSGIDPLDIDTEKAGNYKPGNYSVDEKSVELDSVLDELKSSQHYASLLKVVGKEWDNNSRQVIADNPDVLRTLDAHMNSGIFAKIMSVVDSDRAFGRLSGMSDLEAYRTVGDRLNNQGAFNGLGAKTTAAPKKVVPVKAAPTPSTDSAAKQKKLAASPSRASAPAQQAPFNPLAMSDAELMKLDITKFTTR